MSVNKTEARNVELYRWGLRYLYLYSLKKQEGLSVIANELLAACASVPSTVQVWVCERG